MAHFWSYFYHLWPLLKKILNSVSQKSLYSSVAVALLCVRWEMGLTVRLCSVLTLNSKPCSTIQLYAACVLSVLKASAPLLFAHQCLRSSDLFKKSLSLHPNLKHHQALRLGRAFSQLSAPLDCLIVADSNGLKWVLTVSQFKHTSLQTCIRAWEWECVQGLRR